MIDQNAVRNAVTTNDEIWLRLASSGEVLVDDIHVVISDLLSALDNDRDDVGRDTLVEAIGSLVKASRKYHTSILRREEQND